MRRSGFVAWVMGVVAALVIVGGFMSLDRTVGHWYVEEPLTADDVAGAILGGWDRSQPLKPAEVTGVIHEASPGSAAQLQAALERLANIAALPFLQEEMRLSDQAFVNRVRECQAFLLGRNAIVSACNLEASGQ